MHMRANRVCGIIFLLVMIIASILLPLEYISPFSPTWDSSRIWAFISVFLTIIYAVAFYLGIFVFRMYGAPLLKFLESGIIELIVVSLTFLTLLAGGLVITDLLKEKPDYKWILFCTLIIAFFFSLNDWVLYRNIPKVKNKEIDKERASDV